MQQIPFKPTQIIGIGGFSRVYEGTLENYNSKVAIKAICKQNIAHNERMILQELQQNNQLEYFPKLLHESDSFKLQFLVMPLYGKSLAQLLSQQQDKRLSLKSVCQLGIRLIQALKVLHSKNIIHCDIKHDNILLREINQARCNEFVIIDFGFAHKIEQDTTKDDQNNENYENDFIGNQIFASRRAMNYKNQCKADDLESLFYMLMFLLNGELPWKMKYSQSISFEQICEMKSQQSPQQLWPNLDSYLLKIANMIWSLDFFATPNYDKIISLFKNLILKYREEVDFIYEWNTDLINQKEIKRNSLFRMKDLSSEHLNEIIKSKNCIKKKQRHLSIDINYKEDDKNMPDNQNDNQNIQADKLEFIELEENNVISEKKISFQKQLSKQFKKWKYELNQEPIKEDVENENYSKSFYQNDNIKNSQIMCSQSYEENKQINNGQICEMQEINQIDQERNFSQNSKNNVEDNEVLDQEYDEKTRYDSPQINYQKYKIKVKESNFFYKKGNSDYKIQQSNTECNQLHKTNILQLNMKGMDSFKLENNYLHPLSFSIDDEIFGYEEN